MVNDRALASGTPPWKAPAKFRGPFSRWPRTADAILAIAGFVVAAFLMEGPGDSTVIRDSDEIRIAALPFFAAAAAALYRRRQAPLVALGVVLTVWAVTLPGGKDDLTGMMALVALYSAGRYAAPGRWAYAGIAGVIGLIIIDGIMHSIPWGEVVFGAVVMDAAWYIGRRVRLRGERKAQQEREEVAEARRILTEERTRIARELHDVVAHRVSIMTVQAGAAKLVAAKDLDRALAAMGAVEEEGRQALAELRHLLGVLRPENGSEPAGPQPGLADLPHLIDQIGGAGVEVSLSADWKWGSGLPDRVDLFAYRIVQEALTNVLKHAGPGTHVEVWLDTRTRGGKEGIGIEVIDDGAGTVTMPPGSGPNGSGGHGLVGMRERALLLGGTLDAGPRPGGGFAVLAHLPTGGEPA